MVTFVGAFGIPRTVIMFISLSSASYNRWHSQYAVISHANGNNGNGSGSLKVQDFIGEYHALQRMI